ncbi:uncharacterized protein LOC127005207 [Eriocheir sinensis]|uniref:uncharacterized protein LOC127005207 n=1 Tax=Eriocheir sinensis TaxID=95602 RepID=UPI0021CA11A3|nr:uncharacterized protein LOC127005207 [Eriocheir sinensis]
MRLLLAAVTAAMLMAPTSALFKVPIESSEPPLSELPGILEILGITDLLGLSGRLEVRGSNLLQQETHWDKVRYGMATAGVALAEIGAIIGYFGNFLRTKEKEKLEAEKEAEAEAAALEEAEVLVEEGAEEGGGGPEVKAGERVHLLKPSYGPAQVEYSRQPAYRPAPRRPARYPRPYPPRTYRQRVLLKRSEAGTNETP